MSSFETAYNWMMDNEDAARTCAQVPDAPPGAFAISGINSAAWPEEFEAIAALSEDQREPLVQEFYENHFWNNWYAQMVSDDLCKRVFDFAVNAGSAASVRCLQQALNALAGSGGAQLVDDSDWGPITVDAANSADSAALVAAFQAERAAFYQAIVAAKPSLSIYLAAWTVRAQK
jgi:lysozyme family protein